MNKPVIFSAIYKGILLRLELRQWAELLNKTYSCMIYRYRQWKLGRMKEEDVISDGILNANRGRPGRKIEKGLDMSFLYRPMRPQTQYLIDEYLGE